MPPSVEKQKVSIGIMPGKAQAKITKSQKLAAVFSFDVEKVSKSESKSEKTEDPIESFSTEVSRKTSREKIKANKRIAAPDEAIMTCKAKRSRRTAVQIVPQEPCGTSLPTRTQLRANAGKDIKMQQRIEIQEETIHTSLTRTVKNGEAPKLPAAVENSPCRVKRSRQTVSATKVPAPAEKTKPATVCDLGEKLQDDCRSESSLQRIRKILGEPSFGDGASIPMRDTKGQQSRFSYRDARLKLLVNDLT